MRLSVHYSADRLVGPVFHEARWRSTPKAVALVGALGLACTLASCSSTSSARGAASHPGGNAAPTAPTTSTTYAPTTTTTTAPPGPQPLPAPSALTPFAPPPTATDGTWTPAGRTVNAFPAVYETRLIPPGGSAEAGIAWMDMNLLSAQLYSGSKSPGGGPYMFTAPIQPTQATSLVAAFNGGFLMKDAQGGYLTEGRTIYPLVTGAASLVIHTDGSVSLGAWGTDVSMTPDVVAVRQNLVPLVEGGQPTPQASNPNWGFWGATCGVSSCSGGGIENQWRSGAGITADGALVYVAGPSLDPLQLAQLLVQAGAVRGMELDINPSWPVFATYSPPAGAPAAPANGASMPPAADQGPATFFEASWARDFVTMSARTTAVGASGG